MKSFIFSIFFIFAISSLATVNAEQFRLKCAPQSRLLEINVKYVNFNNQDSIGRIQVMDTLAPYVKNIFSALYKIRFPIYSMHEPRKGTFSDTSLYISNAKYNNTAAYACRSITGRSLSLPSIHAYGAAIDLNPKENPYIGFSNPITPSHTVRTVTKIIPQDGWIYISRSKYREGKPPHLGIINSAINNIFKNNGFLRWGGDWYHPIDYMHFEVYRDVDILLLTMNPEEARKYFEKYVEFYHVCRAKYPNQYAQMKFNDLNEAISIVSETKPMELYINSGFTKLMSIVAHINKNPNVVTCVRGPHKEDIAYSEIEAIRAKLSE